MLARIAKAMAVNERRWSSSAVAFSEGGYLTINPKSQSRNPQQKKARTFVDA